MILKYIKKNGEFLLVWVIVGSVVLFFRVIFFVGDIGLGLGWGRGSLLVILFWIVCFIGVRFWVVGKFVILGIDGCDFIVILVVEGIEVD